MENKTRNVLIMTSAIALVLVLLAGIYLYPINVERQNASSINFITVNKGPGSNSLENQSIIARNQQQLDSLWSLMATDDLPPEVDFNNDMLIAVFQGQKPTGGYSTEIVVIEEFPDKIQVGVVEKSPGENCAVTLAATSPFHIVKIPKTDKPIEFNYSQVVDYC